MHRKTVVFCIYNNIIYTYSFLLHNFLSSTSNVLNLGLWSDEGCSRNTKLSNTSVTVCECTHLTHFAILLSASPPTFTEEVIFSLNIFGYVCYTISLISMAIVIFTFTVLKYVYYTFLSSVGVKHSIYFPPLLHLFFSLIFF